MMTLTITVDDQNHLEVNGPIDDIMVCYAVLELAKDVIRARVMQRARTIIPAQSLPSGLST